MPPAGSGIDSGPATIRPRRPRAASTKPATASGDGACATRVTLIGAAGNSKGTFEAAASMRGSRNGKLMWTGPIGASRATEAARAATACAVCSSAAVPSAGGMSTNQRTWLPYSRTWSMVCAAPTSRSSGGRSAVRTTSGMRGDRGLDHGGEKVRGGSTRGTDERHRFPELSRETEREVPGRALVEMEPGAERRVAREGQRQGCRARTGADDHVVHAAVVQLCDERANDAIVCAHDAE